MIRQRLLVVVLLALTVDADLVNVNATVGVKAATAAPAAQALAPDASLVTRQRHGQKDQALVAVEAKAVTAIKTGLKAALNSKIKVAGEELTLGQAFDMIKIFYFGQFNPERFRRYSSEDLYTSVFFPNFLFAILLMSYQSVEIARSGSQDKICNILNVPSGFEAVTRKFNPMLDPEFPNVGHYSPVILHVENKQTQNGKWRSVTYLKPYVRGISALENGVLGWMMHSGSELNEFEYFDKDELLVALDCNALDEAAKDRAEDIEHQHKVNHLQDYIEEVGHEDQGKIMAQKLYFTSLRLLPGYIYCRGPSTDKHSIYVGVDPTAPDGQTTPGDALMQNKGIPGACDQNGMADLGKYFLQMGYDMQITREAELRAAGMNPFQPLKYPFVTTGRDYFQFESKSDRTHAIIGIIAGIAIFFSGVIPAFIAVVTSHTDTFDLEPIAQKPAVLLFQFTGGILLVSTMVVIICFTAGPLKPIIGDLGVRGLIKFVVFVMAFALPFRMFYLSKKVITYKSLTAVHVLELGLEMAQHVLAITFFAHAVVMWLKGAFSVPMSGLFNPEFADLILGLTGYLDSVVATINGVRDAHGMGDQCDLIHLKEIVEEATADVQGDKQFSVDCSEWPSAPNDPFKIWKKMSYDWGWDDLVSEYDEDRKDISDQATCIVHCKNDLGVHDTIVKCTPAGLLGGRWSLEYQDVIKHRICIRHDATYNISIGYEAETTFNATEASAAAAPTEASGAAASEEANATEASAAAASEEAEAITSLSHMALAL